MLIYFIFIIFFYLILISGFTFYFKKAISIKNTFELRSNICLSIIVPARNEAHQIPFLLDSILKQNYNKQFFEVIIVDDASTDNTSEVIKSFISKHADLNIKLLRIEEDIFNPTFKKNALTNAINIAEGELIITTDADCVFGPDWLESIANYYSVNQFKFIIGMVAYHNDSNVFMKMQHLEFLSLIATGIGSLRMGYPIMCNGANLIFQKKVFIDIDGYKSDKNIVSGDDVLLMLKVKKYYGKSSISYLIDKKSIIYTSASTTLNEFVNQRIRWASKAKFYRDFPILIVAIIVFLYNFLIGLCFVSAIISVKYIYYALSLLLIKSIIDFPILYLISKYINRKDLLLYYLPLQFLYFPYVLIIGVLSFIKPYKWKGRIVRI